MRRRILLAHLHERGAVRLAVRNPTGSHKKRMRIKIGVPAPNRPLDHNPKYGICLATGKSVVVTVVRL